MSVRNKELVLVEEIAAALKRQRQKKRLGQRRHGTLERNQETTERLKVANTLLKLVCVSPGVAVGLGDGQACWDNSVTALFGVLP